MVRKYIVDSVVYWATEYKIDGFRFDLMALHDLETMRQVREALDAIDPRIIVYGEGWHAGGSPLPQNIAALKMNASQAHERIGFFSDDIRDAITGSVFDRNDRGFASGNLGANIIETVKFGIAASVEHPQIRYALTRSGRPWAKEPTQTVTYISAHDNHTLWDKLYIKGRLDPVNDKDLIVQQNKLAAVSYLTAQGMMFIHAGEEFGRTKFGDENSYRSPDSINRLDWERRTEFDDLVEYYKGLIKLRSEHPAFRMSAADDIRRNLTFLDIDNATGVIGYTLNNNANGDEWETVAVLLNGSDEPYAVTLPQDGWALVVNGSRAGTELVGFLTGSTAVVPPRTAYVLVDAASFGASMDRDYNINDAAGAGASRPNITAWGLIGIIALAGAASLAGGILLGRLLQKRNHK
jgi:pullulanase